MLKNYSTKIQVIFEITKSFLKIFAGTRGIEPHPLPHMEVCYVRNHYTKGPKSRERESNPCRTPYESVLAPTPVYLAILVQKRPTWCRREFESPFKLDSQSSPEDLTRVPDTESRVGFEPTVFRHTSFADSLFKPLRHLLLLFGGGNRGRTCTPILLTIRFPSGCIANYAHTSI